jgi:hypothetical protein
LTTTAHRNGTKSDTKRTRLGDGKIPKALLEADIATLKAALQQRQKEEIQSILEQIREIDAQRTELNAKLMGLGFRSNGSGAAPRPMAATRGVRGKRSELADGLAETTITEGLQENPGERGGFYYDKVITLGGNIGQARRILAALVAGGKVKAEGNRPHTRYSLA